jgi:hypothetical protein
MGYSILSISVMRVLNINASLIHGPAKIVLTT